jgi:sugar lactone lactonase YvrE
MGKTGHMAENGALYRYHRGELRRLRTGVAIPNAICFAPDGRRGYFADTMQDRVFTWPLDAEGWPSAEPEVFFDFSGIEGGPDGAVVDSQGAIWVALWGGSRVLRILPDGTPGAEIALPASRITCPAFGADLCRLYVTSAWTGLVDDRRAHEPQAGRVFVTDIAVPGLPEPMVALAH